jgi:hypothetical protein
MYKKPDISAIVDESVKNRERDIARIDSEIRAWCSNITTDINLRDIIKDRVYGKNTTFYLHSIVTSRIPDNVDGEEMVTNIIRETSIERHGNYYFLTKSVVVHITNDRYGIQIKLLIDDPKLDGKKVAMIRKGVPNVRCPMM